MIKKCSVIVLLLLSFLTSGYRKPIMSGSFDINASNNAVFHNSLGVRYLQEHCYYAAVQEFKIAISLKTDAQSTAVSYNNLGRAYFALGFAERAQDCFEKAIQLYGLNFEYYQNLASCYVLQKKGPQKLEEYKKDTSNPMNKIMVGLLYISLGQKRAGIITLDSFCNAEPDLIITSGVQNYIRSLTNPVMQNGKYKK